MHQDLTQTNGVVTFTEWVRSLEWHRRNKPSPSQGYVNQGSLEMFLCPIRLSYIKDARTSVLNSLYDSVQLHGILRLPCPDESSSCTQQRLNQLQQFQTRCLFVTACCEHEESCQDIDWDGIHVNGVSQRQAFGDWIGISIIPKSLVANSLTSTGQKTNHAPHMPQVDKHTCTFRTLPVYT